ncbi:MAG: tRNA uracil 4-sulfurtransferase ThiI [Candidatus Thorarchaeota archaeon]
MPVEYTAVLLRYGEIGIKSKQTRRRMTGLLVKHIRLALEEHNVPYSAIIDEWGRIFIETDQVMEAARVASQIFGIVSVSPVVVTSSDMDSILDVGEQLALAEFESGKSFAVRARRIGTHEFSSQDVRERLGERLFEGVPQLELTVDLKNPDQFIYVEVRDDKAYLFTRVIDGVGGMPTGTQGKVVCTVSTGLDSPIAAYKVMKRGCIPVFVYFDNSPYCDAVCTDIAIRQAQILANFIYGFDVKMYIVPHGPDLDDAMKHGPEKMTCIFCKRNMLRLAREVAMREGADAIVTGEIIGEQASQTTANLKVIDSVVTDLPVLRPLAGDDKVDITRLAQRIGTYQFADEGASCCTLAPQYPAIASTKEAALKAETDMDVSILKSEIDRARIVVLRNSA